MSRFKGWCKVSVGGFQKSNNIAQNITEISKELGILFNWLDNNIGPNTDAWYFSGFNKNQNKYDFLIKDKGKAMIFKLTCG